MSGELIWNKINKDLDQYLEIDKVGFVDDLYCLISVPTVTRSEISKFISSSIDNDPVVTGDLIADYLHDLRKDHADKIPPPTETVKKHVEKLLLRIKTDRDKEKWDGLHCLVILMFISCIKLVILLIASEKWNGLHCLAIMMLISCIKLVLLLITS